MPNNLLSPVLNAAPLVLLAALLMAFSLPAFADAHVHRGDEDDESAHTDHDAPDDHGEAHEAHEHDHERPSANAVRRAAPKLDVGLDLLFAGGASSAKNEELRALQGGAHDPKRRGFTLQQAELSLRASMQPSAAPSLRLSGAAFLSMREDAIELEEAFASIHHAESGLRLDAGQFLTRFGLYNDLHPHQWHWLDQPIATTRMLGEEGTRAPGARLLWYTQERSFGVEAGFQDLQSGLAPSFLSGFGGHHHHEGEEEEEALGVGGRPLIEREVHSFNDFLSTLRFAGNLRRGRQDLWIGVDAAYGPNATGIEGKTTLFAAGLRYRLHDADTADAHTLPLLEVGLEFLLRSYDAQAGVEEGAPMDPTDDIGFDQETFEDYALTLDLGYRVHADWVVGLRGEYAWGNSLQSFDHDDEAFISRQQDPLRADRLRATLGVTWYLAEHSRLIAQYNFDQLDLLEDDQAHTVWVGFDLYFGGANHSHD